MPGIKYKVYISEASFFHLGMGYQVLEHKAKRLNEPKAP